MPAHTHSGGPAWQQLPLGGERLQGAMLEKTSAMRNGLEAEQSRSSISLAAGEAGEAGVQVRCSRIQETEERGCQARICSGRDRLRLCESRYPYRGYII